MVVTTVSGCQAVWTVTAFFFRCNSPPAPGWRAVRGSGRCHLQEAELSYMSQLCLLCQNGKWWRAATAFIFRRWTFLPAPSGSTVCVRMESNGGLWLTACEHCKALRCGAGHSQIKDTMFSQSAHMYQLSGLRILTFFISTCSGMLPDTSDQKLQDKGLACVRMESGMGKWQWCLSSPASYGLAAFAYISEQDRRTSSRGEPHNLMYCALGQLGRIVVLDNLANLTKIVHLAELLDETATLHISSTANEG